MDKYEELNSMKMKVLLISQSNEIDTVKKILGNINEIIMASKYKRFLIKGFVNEVARCFSFNSHYNEKKIEECKYYDFDKSLFALVGTLILSLGENPTIKDYKQQINFIVEFLSEYKIDNEDSYDLLKYEEIKSILNLPLVQEAMRAITYKRPLSIINVDYTHIGSDSTCFYAFNLIINSRNRKIINASKINVFIHELGHLLHFNITGNVSIIPESFKDFYETEFNNRWSNLSEVDKEEKYADCFAVACLIGTEYEKDDNIINNNNRMLCDKIKKYFKENINYHISKLNNIKNI